ncbi:TerC family protein [Buchnera aphidicola]|uniref:TerC/Alx family metal homeostasis membrane protein n=1 Tax=Buchnera aphidicola (Aphis aurantii) TaxID=1470492 RepID=A0AAU6W7I4_9GAMM
MKFIIEKHNFKNKIKPFFYFYRWFFIYFFVFLLFISIFWCILYKISGIHIANKNVICFLTSYLLEIILSVDNIFVWFLIFKSLEIPNVYQKKVLFYGLIGALILRFLLSFFGYFVFLKWHWILYFFGVLFIFISLKIFFCSSNPKNEEKNIGLSWIYKTFRITNNSSCKNFFLKINNKIFCTPLFISLVLIELSDLIFSADSIPAVFSITHDLFIILSSNIFSVLGLRSMYFFISPIINKFPMIEYALSIILMFIGFKILFEKFIIISNFFTFSIILIILVATFIINVFFIKKK